MAHATPRYTRSKIDVAGDELARASHSLELLDEALAVINNWRACHRYPLNAIQVTIRARARKIDANAIVPQRLKRMPAIEAKLQLHPGMKLSRMHDIGGCRAILANAVAVRQVVEACRKASAKNPERGAKLIREYDYMDGNSPGPKADGYRGIHLVYQYRSKSPERTDYNGLRIEVQLRSQLQHAFATAVETAGIFTSQPIKSIRANLNDDRWRRFFALMGGALALREGTAPVPQVPAGIEELSSEIRLLADALSVERVLSGWGKTVEQLSGHPIGAKAFLIRLDTEAKTTEVIAYSKKEMPKTEDAYLELEKKFRDKPFQQIVLVDVESIDALRIGYPNFYLDTQAFVDAMKEIIQSP